MPFLLSTEAIRNVWHHTHDVVFSGGYCPVMAFHADATILLARADGTFEWSLVKGVLHRNGKPDRQAKIAHPLKNKGSGSGGRSVPTS